jgi:hypothetical protein
VARRVELRPTSQDEWQDVGPVLPADVDRAAAERCLVAARVMYPHWQHRLRVAAPSAGLTPCPPARTARAAPPGPASPIFPHTLGPVMTEPTTADSTPVRHTCSNQTARPGPDWGCPRCSTLPDAAAPAVSSAGVVQLPPTNQAALVELGAQAVWARYTDAEPSRAGLVLANPHAVAEAVLDAVLKVLPAPVNGAAVYRALADQQTQLAVADDLARRRDMAAARRQLVKELRRMAAEAPATEERSGCPLCGHLGCMGKGRRCNVTMTSESRVWGPPCQCLGVDAAVVQPQPDETPDRIVGYRLAGHRDLHCAGCTPSKRGDIWEPVTSDDLPDGGLCATCHVDVLIPQEPQS